MGQLIEYRTHAASFSSHRSLGRIRALRSPNAIQMSRETDFSDTLQGTFAEEAFLRTLDGCSRVSRWSISRMLNSPEFQRSVLSCGGSAEIGDGLKYWGGGRADQWSGRVVEVENWYGFVMATNYWWSNERQERFSEDLSFACGTFWC